MFKLISTVFVIILAMSAWGQNVDAYFTGSSNENVVIENELIQVTITNTGGKVISWYVNELNQDIACVDLNHSYAVLAQRFGTLDNPINYWPGGWPTEIGSLDYDTEIEFINHNKAVIKQTLVIPDGSIFSGLKVEKFYTIKKGKYHLEIDYKITNISEHKVSYIDNEEEYGINLTVETTMNVGNYLLVLKSKGELTFFENEDFPDVNPQFNQQTQWCAVSDMDYHYVMGSKFVPGQTYVLWAGESRPCGRDYEIIFNPIIYEPGDQANFHFIIYGGPGDADEFGQIASFKEMNEQAEQIQKNEYSLAQNYPNPFNPLTIISYSIPQNAYVTLNVYDLLGRQVAELVNGEVGEGYHQVAFDGSHLVSGIYFYRLTAGNFTQINKMSLVK